MYSIIDAKYYAISISGLIYSFLKGFKWGRGWSLTPSCTPAGPFMAD